MGWCPVGPGRLSQTQNQRFALPVSWRLQIIESDPSGNLLSLVSRELTPGYFHASGRFTTPTYLSLAHVWVILELEVFPLERNWITSPELTGAFEVPRESVLAEVPGQGVCDIGEHKSNVVIQGIWEDGRQGGEHGAQASAARNGPVG